MASTRSPRAAGPRSRNRRLSVLALSAARRPLTRPQRSTFMVGRIRRRLHEGVRRACPTSSRSRRRVGQGTAVLRELGPARAVPSTKRVPRLQRTGRPVRPQIRSLTRLGLSPADARRFLECLLTGHDEGDDCPESLAVYQSRLDDLDDAIQRLSATRDRLASGCARQAAGASARPRSGRREE